MLMHSFTTHIVTGSQARVRVRPSVFVEFERTRRRYPARIGRAPGRLGRLKLLHILQGHVIVRIALLGAPEAARWPVCGRCIRVRVVERVLGGEVAQSNLGYHSTRGTGVGQRHGAGRPCRYLFEQPACLVLDRFTRVILFFHFVKTLSVMWGR